MKVLGSDLMKSFGGHGERTRVDISVGDVGTIKDIFVKPIDEDLRVKLMQEREGFRITENGERDFGRASGKNGGHKFDFLGKHQPLWKK